MTRAMPPRRARAFALVELLVALAIFAVIGAIAWRSLAAVTRTRETIRVESERLADAQFAIALLERDLRQAVARPVRDEYGQPQPALAGSRERVELTSHAFASPYGGPRPQLARIVYAREEDGFARAAFPALDRAPSTRAVRRVLAAGVESVRLRYADGEARWFDEWPPRPQRAMLERMPRAVEFSLQFEGLGTIRRVVDLVEAGLAPP